MNKTVERTSRSGNQATFIQVNKTGPYCGAEVYGADLTRPLSSADFQTIHDAFVAHEVLVFPDADISSNDQIRFGERFGQLLVSPFWPGKTKPEFFTLESSGEKPPFKTDVWHTDESYRGMPPMATVLLARVVPPIGGNTVFASMTAAYDGLSDRMQAFLSGLEAVHDFRALHELFARDPDGIRRLREAEDRLPNPVHPVVRVHPVTGRKAIFVNRLYTRAITGMSERESNALLELLFHLPRIPEYQFRVHWRPGTMTIWDNRSVQHYAPRDYLPHLRRMDRVTISGDVPFGPGDSLMGVGLLKKRS
jgi:taurine dioxygenase